MKQQKSRKMMNTVNIGFITFKTTCSYTYPQNTVLTFSVKTIFRQLPYVTTSTDLVYIKNLRSK